ncbi:hypothetical protein BM525_20815 (plasmid) [Alteromonas mediterranea]|uniref:Uncharacterized protein n=1 Tax=Alteromonas mediterranea TaxID=314275 RepID=A0AAC9JFT8_9ALTE|nr:PcfJ domain-containing protein [Alteromonas mediterranea]APD92307.1 hypothetical protein BM524_20590 [Alteromonas mediterranea]APE00168.1 hypothetical protein BM525_20815 [Alteromonas mediterranea]
MPTFSEKYNQDMPEPQDENQQKARSVLKRMLDVSAPSVKAFSIDGLADGYAIYRPEKIVNSANKVGLPDDVFSTTGTVSLYLRRATDNAVIPVHKTWHGDHAGLDAIIDNLGSHLIKLGHDAESVRAFMSGADVGGLRTLHRVSYRDELTKKYVSNSRVNISHHDIEVLSPNKQGLDGIESYGSTGVEFNKFVHSDDGARGNLELNVADIFSDAMSEACGVNGSVLKKKMDAEWERTYQMALDATSKLRNEAIVNVCPGVESVEALKSAHPEFELNYIGSAPSESAMLYRKQFIDTFNEMLGMKDFHYSVRSRLLNDVLETSSMSQGSYEGYPSQKILDAVDEGKSFIPVLAAEAGTPNMSKKEFRRAMEIFRVNNSPDLSYTRPNLSTKKMAFALAKLPEEWFHTTVSRENGDVRVDALLTPALGFPSEATVAAEEFMRTAARLGSELDRLKGKGDKKEMKSIIRPWDFISKKKDLFKTLEHLESKYKIGATSRDYPEMLAQFASTVTYGSMHRSSYLNDDAVDFDPLDNALCINTRHVTEKVKDQLRDAEYEYLEQEYDKWESNDDIQPLFDGEISVEHKNKVYTLTALDNVADTIDYDFKKELKSGEVTGIVVSQGDSESLVGVNVDYTTDMLSLHEEFEHVPVAAVVKELIESVNKGEHEKIKKENITTVQAQKDNVPSHPEDFFDDDITQGQVFVNIEGFEINSALRKSSKGTSFIGLLEMNEELHKHYANFVQDANISNKDNFTWEPLLNEPVALTSGLEEKFTLSSINTRLGLLEEGTAMSHCVFSYLQRCMAGESAILSLKDENDNRVATLELTFNDERDRCEIGDFYGYGNSKVPGHINDMVMRFVDSVNQGNSPHINEDDISRTADQEFDDDILLEVENSPLKKGSVVSIIPYDGSAVYLAALALEEYTPSDIDVESIMSASELNYTVYSESGIREGLEKIKSLAKEVGMTPLSAARIMTINDLVPDSKELENELVKYKTINRRVNELRLELTGQLSVDQIGSEINDALSEEFGVTLFEPKKMAAGYQDVVAIAQSIRAQQQEARKTPDVEQISLPGLESAPNALRRA